MGTLSSLAKIDFNPLYDSILKCHKRGGKILIMGNGGSAANASHMATGISYVTRNWDNPIAAIAIGMDSILTSSLANDHGYENVFLRQLQVLLSEKDLVIGISVSGNSPNVVKAMEYAAHREVETFLLAGHDGGLLAKTCPHKIVISQNDCLYGLTEDVHMIIGHIIAYYLEFNFKSDRKS